MQIKQRMLMLIDFHFAHFLRFPRFAPVEKFQNSLPFDSIETRCCCRFRLDLIMKLCDQAAAAYFSLIELNFFNRNKGTNIGSSADYNAKAFYYAVILYGWLKASSSGARVCHHVCFVISLESKRARMTIEKSVLRRRFSDRKKENC